MLAHVKALESEAFLRDKAGVDRARWARFPRERINPNGGSVALGHPFGATGARILSQAVKELAARPAGQRAIVSICADGGQGSVVLLESGPGTITAPGPSRVKNSCIMNSSSSALSSGRADSVRSRARRCESQ